MAKNNPSTPRVKTATDAIDNLDGTYPGNLNHYYQALMLHSTGLRNPFHNYELIIYVFWHCYRAGLWHFEKKFMTQREIRDLLIASLFFCFNHSGNMKDPDAEIEKAINALYQFILPEDAMSLEKIQIIILGMLFNCLTYKGEPPKVELNLSQQIICDVIPTRILPLTWQQSILFGLGQETGRSPIEMLELQEHLILRVLEFKTTWAQLEFTRESRADRVAQARHILGMIRTPNPLLEQQAKKVITRA
jgi:hypothetical protein